MEDTKQLALVGNETPEQAEAIGLHYEIVSAAQAAASSLLDLGRKLKRMKNTKKQKEKEKRCAACVWRDRKTATPLCALPRCIYEERKPRRDKVKRYGEV